MRLTNAPVMCILELQYGTPGESRRADQERSRGENRNHYRIQRLKGNVLSRKEQARKRREVEWILLADAGWAMNSLCSSCGEVKHVRGKRKGYLKCKECFVGI